MSNKASAWKIAAEQRESARRAAEPTATITLPGFEDFPFVGRRLPYAEWLRNGVMPQFLADKFAEIADKGGGDDTNIEISGAETLLWMRFQKRVITEVVVEPVIVFEDRPLAENEVAAAQLPHGLLMAIYNWAMSLSKGVPVATADGETTVEAVETFRRNQLGQDESNGAGLPLSQVRGDAVSASGIA